MTDPILYFSVLWGLIGVLALISSFAEDVDDSDDSEDDGERYIYNLEYVKVGKYLFISSLKKMKRINLNLVIYWIRRINSRLEFSKSHRNRKIFKAEIQWLKW